MSRPDFIGLGAMKTGTTWLHQCLLEHPEINLSEKELNFFGDPVTWSKGFDWYEKKLESDKKIIGEFSVFYLAHPFVASRIHARYPDIKAAWKHTGIHRTYHWLHTNDGRGGGAGNLPNHERHESVSGGAFVIPNIRNARDYAYS